MPNINESFVICITNLYIFGSVLRFCNRFAAPNAPLRLIQTTARGFTGVTLPVFYCNANTAKPFSNLFVTMITVLVCDCLIHSFFSVHAC